MNYTFSVAFMCSSDRARATCKTLEYKGILKISMAINSGSTTGSCTINEYEASLFLYFLGMNSCFSQIIQ